MSSDGAGGLERGDKPFGLVVLLLIASTCGCGRKDNVAVVEGSVSYAGKRVMNGDIRFYPTDGTQGPTCGAPIVDGHYKAENKGGVPVGKHQVVIRAFVLEDIGPVSGQSGGGDLLTPASAKQSAKPQMPIYVVEGRSQFIPRKYNAHTELIAKVTGDSNPQSIDFDLPEVPK